MTQKALIQQAYDAFALFEKPKQCTKYTDFEEGEFNAILLSSTQRSLTMEQVGTVCWSPISAMTPEALAYFMPRLIELALTRAVDRDGEPFFCHFINAFSEGPENEKSRLFGQKQRAVMADVFTFLIDTFREELTRQGWLDEAGRAVVSWSTA